MSLVLRATGVDRNRPGLRWRWSLADEHGAELATYDVDLDPGRAEYEAFVDLPGFLRRHRAPDDPVGTEAQIVDRVGRWLTDAVLGPSIARQLAVAAPATVCVRLPDEALFLLDRPLELAVLGSRPLSGLGIGLVMTAERDGAPPAKRPAAGALRILALFSMPSRASVLAQRRERDGLERLVRRLGEQGHSVELRALQYGVTRQTLAEAVADRDGWDVLHLSGHGAPGSVVLEHEDGSLDPVSTPELVTLLRPLADRLKLAVLSACDSGRATAADTLRLLDLAEQADAVQPSADEDRAVPGVARGLVGELGIAVVAMRYPVADDFAVAFAGELYPRLLTRRRSVDVAFRQALADTVDSVPAATRRALNGAAPALFGAAATGLTLIPPRVQPVAGDPVPGRAGLPPPPDRFVGRAGLMFAAGRVLAPGSSYRGILFAGMAGAGKTTCATEIAHQYAARFEATVWWTASAENGLPGLAERWELRLGSQLDEARALVAGLAVLVVLDNVEVLADDDGRWDPEFVRLLDVLCAPGARSRVILTSRVAPDGLPSSVLVEPTHALTLAESALLARELPHLGPLLTGQRGNTAEVAAGRLLVRRVLGVVQGHPKLLELADAAAADPAGLNRRLDAARRGAAPVRDFFASGASRLDEPEFLRTLHDWAARAVAALDGPDRLLAEVLACAVDSDRQLSIVEPVWDRLWQTEHEGAVPTYGDAVARLQHAHLIVVQELGPEDGVEIQRLPGPAADRPTVQVYRLHPAIAEVIRSAADDQRLGAVEDLLGEWLGTLGHQAVESPLVVGACIAAAPYFIRRRRWSDAAAALHHAAQRAMPVSVLRRSLDQLRPGLTAETDRETRLRVAGTYGYLLSQVDPASAVRQLRSTLAEARRAELWEVAAVAAGNLVNALTEARSPAEALRANRELIQLQQKAGAGPFTRLLAEVQQLQIYLALGRYDEVIRKAGPLLDDLDRSPAPAQPEMVVPLMVAETLLGTAAAAAVALGQHELALRLNEEHQRRMRTRNATLLECAAVAINAVPMLIPLGRLDGAERALSRCQAVHEEEGDLSTLGVVFTYRAELELARGRPGDAAALQERALRYLYQWPRPLDQLATGHRTLARCREALGTNSAEHFFAAALLESAGGRPGRVSGVLTPHGGRYDLGFILDELITAPVEKVPGVRFGEVLAAVLPDRADRSRLLATTMAPMLAETLGLLRRGPAHGLTLGGFLDVLACTREWEPLVAVLRRTRPGQPPDVDGLDDVSAAIVRRVLS